MPWATTAIVSAAAVTIGVPLGLVVALVRLVFFGAPALGVSVEPLPPFLGAALLYGVVIFAVVLTARALERSLVRRYGTL